MPWCQLGNMSNKNCCQKLHNKTLKNNQRFRMEHDAWVTDFREWSLAETSATVALAAANLAFISAEENT